MAPMEVNWPRQFDRTPPEQRVSTSKFDVGYRRTKGDIKREMERLGVDEWRIDDVTGSGGDPGVVVRWRMGDADYAAAADIYTAKKDNAREIYLWIKETRMRANRPVKTGGDDFAAARLPPGDPEREHVVARNPPHVVLQVDRDASDEVVKAAYRARSKEVHADQGGSTEAMKRLNRAKEQMLDGSE